MEKHASSKSASVSPRILGFVLCTIGLLLALIGLGGFASPTARAQGATSNQPKKDVQVVASYHNDVSQPVRDMPPWIAADGRQGGEREANENPKIPYRHVDGRDPVVQSYHAPTLNFLAPSIPTPIRNFDGVGFPGVGCSCAPPDTNGAVGSTQYVQIVNEGYQVFNKSTGTSVLGPNSISSIWTGFGGVCETGGKGDPVVLYDHLANR